MRLVGLGMLHEGERPRREIDRNLEVAHDVGGFSLVEGEPRIAPEVGQVARRERHRPARRPPQQAIPPARSDRQGLAGTDREDDPALLRAAGGIGAEQPGAVGAFGFGQRPDEHVFVLEDDGRAGQSSKHLDQGHA